MSKKKSIVSYEKLTIDQKKELLIAFPEGFAGATTKMTNPITGEIFDSLLWDTEEITYLVKLPKLKLKSPSVDDDEDEEIEEDLDAIEEKDDEEDMGDEEEEDNYGDKAEDEAEEGEED